MSNDQRKLVVVIYLWQKNDFLIWLDLFFSPETSGNGRQWIKERFNKGCYLCEEISHFTTYNVDSLLLNEIHDGLTSYLVWEQHPYWRESVKFYVLVVPRLPWTNDTKPRKIQSDQRLLHRLVVNPIVFEQPMKEFYCYSTNTLVDHEGSDNYGFLMEECSG